METIHDRNYVDARETLLDAVEALGPHGDAVILVGAQAIYVHTVCEGSNFRTVRSSSSSLEID